MLNDDLKGTTESAPPPGPPSPVAWMRANLFNSWLNAILTILSLVLIYFVVKGAVTWFFVTADWRPITQAPLLFLIGQYPRDEIWRVGVSLSLISLMAGVSWGVWRRSIQTFALLMVFGLAALAAAPDQSGSLTTTHRLLLVMNAAAIVASYLLVRRTKLGGSIVLVGWLLLFFVIPVLLSGFGQAEFLPKVETSSWGGLMVTLLLAVGGILISFPIGVLLALGRRSSLPIVSGFSTIFIEAVRGVPLVSILFMSSIILALFLPPEIRIDRLVRALLGMALFSAAYTAENVRGGLQSIPQGQYEAAKAVGLNGFQTTVFIVLPQALRIVIPAIVGQFISLFKDTTLAVIVAINELLNIGKSILQSDPEFIGLQSEVYIFIAVIFWIFSYLMSFASRQLETALGVGKR